MFLRTSASMLYNCHCHRLTISNQITSSRRSGPTGASRRSDFSDQNRFAPDSSAVYISNNPFSTWIWANFRDDTPLRCITFTTLRTEIDYMHGLPSSKTTFGTNLLAKTLPLSHTHSLVTEDVSCSNIDLT